MKMSMEHWWNDNDNDPLRWSRMGSIGCPETSVMKYHYLLRNSPEECSLRLRRGGSLKSHKFTLLFDMFVDQCVLN